MKILVASFDTMVGISGGWTSTCDLLERDHRLVYVVGRGKSKEVAHCENIMYYVVNKYLKETMKSMIEYVFEVQQCDFVLAQGDREGAICAELGLPFVLRLHTLPYHMPMCEAVAKKAFWVIENHPIEKLKHIVDDVIPHSIDLKKYHFDTNRRAELSVLIATLNHIEDPILYVNAIKNTKNNELRGKIYGDGVIKSEVEYACSISHKKCELRKPVLRNNLPDKLKACGIGVSTLHPNSPNKHQLKVLIYQALGIYPVVQKDNILNQTEPDLCEGYHDQKHLTDILDYLCKEGPIKSSLIMGRKYVEDNFNARYWSKIFNEKLEKRWNER